MWSLQLAVKPPGHNLIHIDKWFLKMYHTCVFMGLAIYGHSDHETNITIEFTLKNGSWRCITLVFARLATYGHSDHKTNITVEFTSKNGSRKCITLVFLPDLPNMVTLITKLTAINGVYTKTIKFHYRHAYRSSRIGPITTTSRLPIALICYECGYNVFLLKG